MHRELEKLQSLVLARTLVMGIINATPDSFSGDGLGHDVDGAVAQGLRMIGEGADILDVGGQSTRPGADTITLEEEIARVVPVVERLAREGNGTAISVDTNVARVAEEAVRAGATIINDISGLRDDPEIAEVAARYDTGLVLMHIQGTPRTMQVNPHYEDLIGEVKEYLRNATEKAIRTGVKRERIWVDPGIGFGKTIEHNLEILRRLAELKTLGYPILIGTSRKAFIGRILAPLNGGEPVAPQERVIGTGATVAIAIANGADAVRVHDVAHTVQVARVADAIVRGVR